MSKASDFRNNQKVNVNLDAVVVEQAEFEKIVSELEENLTMAKRELIRGHKCDIKDILDRCKKASKDGYYEIFLQEENDENLSYLTPLDEEALCKLIEKITHQRNTRTVEILCDNHKISLKWNNPHSMTLKKKESIELRFEEHEKTLTKSTERGEN